MTRRVLSPTDRTVSGNVRLALALLAMVACVSTALPVRASAVAGRVPSGAPIPPADEARPVAGVQRATEPARTNAPRADVVPRDDSAAERRPHRGFEGSGLEHLVPELAGHPYRLDPGVRPFQHRFAFSPGFGGLGKERLFAFRFAYNPNQWLGYEASFGHNPGQSVHAVLHTLSALVRRPLPGRFQPYASVGYGMVMVFPGRSLNADPVTKNAVTIGGGLEFYVRDDIAVRGELLHATVFGQQKDRDGLVAFDYLQQTIAVTFYRTIQP